MPVIVCSESSVHFGMDHFIQSVRQLGTFPASQISLLLNEISVRPLKKEACLLREGQVCPALYFLAHGSLRQYHKTVEGTERILNLFLERDWVTDYQSFLSQKPSRNFIQAFEDSEVIELSICSLHKLIGQSHVFFKMGRLLEAGIQPVNLYTEFSSPEERYREVLAKKPLWFQKFPLHLIASYLGVAPETLSRIRRRISVPTG